MQRPPSEFRKKKTDRMQNRESLLSTIGYLYGQIHNFYGTGRGVEVKLRNKPVFFSSQVIMIL